MHTILRNGNPYDCLDENTHAVTQIARSLAHDMRGDTFTVRDESGEEYYSISVSTSKAWKVKNGAFYTGGDIEEHSAKATT